MNTFGERLKHLRGAQSQAAFAKVFGIPQMTLSNYETGKSEPKFGLLSAICKQFSVSSDWLLFGRGPMRPSAHADDAQPPALTSAQAQALAPALSSVPSPAQLSPAAPTLHNHTQPVGAAPSSLPTGMPESLCPRCAKLDLRLEEMERERRELTLENRQLWRENATLREENATLRERQYQRASQHTDTTLGTTGVGL